LSVTPAVKKVLGHEPKEIIGRSMLELCHPEDAKSIIAEGLSGGFDTKTCTSRVKHKEGHYVWIETTINIVRGVSRRASRLICVSRDISKRKRTEIELLTTKAKLESFIDHNVDPILIFDQDYRLVRINGAYEKTFGWSYGEVIHKHISEMPMTPPERIDEIHQNLEMMSQGKPIIGFETIRMCKDGNVIPVHLTAFPLRNEQGLISGCSMSLRDISERKQAEQFALNSEKLSITGQLAAGIAHEIRNPITAIKGFIQLMNSGEGGKHRYFDIILSEIARIELISSELLLLAKPQAVSVKPQDIVLQLTQVRTLLESQAHLNNVQMILDLNPDEAYVSCDENQLKQVWINFVKNAIEAMPGGGKLVIRLRRKGDRYITVDIKDEGCGIPQDALDKLGQPFYTTKEKGTGLGFMVSKRIVDNHNGTITVQSKQYVGTTVTVCLPFEESNL
ncbi:MAG: hypothetical protein K0Q59_703, partial [Paenibacillus sp.]|nr:hypothetical protein [Paenibacillus sp.]